MRAGKVVGRVWSTKKLEQLPVGALLRIELEAGAGTVIAFDPLGCGEHEEVLVSTGTTARGYFTGADTLVDAVVIASLDDAATNTNPKSK